MLETVLKAHIKEIPDFPKPGISFKDITPIFLKPDLVKRLLDQLEEQAKAVNADVIAGIDARGFLLGPALAMHLGIPFIPIRKAGKLPRETVCAKYDLEYGTATVELHKEDVQKGQRVLIHDDLLATGGTAKAAASLIQDAGAKVCGFQFIVELDFLKDREVITKEATVYSQVSY
jgi:adenine phosphoribosyltransferase